MEYFEFVCFFILYWLYLNTVDIFKLIPILNFIFYKIKYTFDYKV